MVVQHKDLVINKFIVTYEDGKTEEVQVEGVDLVVVKIPEGTVYQMTIEFFVKNRTLNKLRYKQEFKKGGIVLKTKNLYVGDSFEPTEEPHRVTFEKDTSPSGFLFRGSFPATSTYYADDEELFVSPWTLEISKK